MSVKNLDAPFVPPADDNLSEQVGQLISFSATFSGFFW